MSNHTATQLARKCAYSSQAPEWEEFVVHVMPVVVLAARRVAGAWGDSTSSTVREIVQDTFLRICEDDRRVLREFEDRGDDSFNKLLKVITASVGTDYFRRIRAEKRGGRTHTVPLTAQLPLDQLEEQVSTELAERITLLGQLDNMLLRHRDQVSVRDRRLFWLYYRQGLTADAISRIPAVGLTAKGVESALARLTRLLRESILNGKTIPVAAGKKPPERLRKGFPVVIAIDSVKRK